MRSFSDGRSEEGVGKRSDEMRLSTNRALILKVARSVAEGGVTWD